MQSLLGHGEENEITSLLCSLEHDHAEWKTRDTGREMRLFVPRSDGEKWGSGLPGNGIARKRRLRCS
jgi:hypothetical protein